MPLFNLLLWLVVGGLIFYVLWWGLNQIGLPEPFHKVAVVVLVIAAVIFLLYTLGGVLPPLPRWK